MNKYGNQKVEINGIKFASKHEANRYIELKYMERAGIISDLRLQVPYELIPVLKDGTTGRVLERAVKYIADFTYMENGKLVVEDAKSPATRTKAYVLKRKLMLWRHDIQIREV